MLCTREPFESHLPLRDFRHTAGEIRQCDQSHALVTVPQAATGFLAARKSGGSLSFLTMPRVKPPRTRDT